MTDWEAWHAAYEDPQSSLSKRLEVVTRRLAEALESLEPVRPRILSLCAGDGRDVVSVLSTRRDVAGRVVLVERDAALAGRAAASAAAAQLTGIEVRCADAGLSASFMDALPVEVLLLCGVFGNVDHDRVRSLVGTVPGLVVPGGFVIWTRGGSAPDRRPEIRRWFAEAGMEEVAFDGDPALYGVGLHRRPRGAPGAGALRAGALPERLFSFESAGLVSPSREGRRRP